MNNPVNDSQAKTEVVIVLGGPGSGKSTQSKLILKEYDYIDLSAGDLLRNEVNSNSENSQMIKQIMEEGKLVPSKLLIDLLKKEIEKIGRDKKFLLDGFPRSKENKDAWDEYAGDLLHIRFAIYFEESEELMKKRVLYRAQLENRLDDNEETLFKRIRTFTERTLPIIAQYETSGLLKTVHREESESIEDIFAKVKKIFEEN